MLGCGLGRNEIWAGLDQPWDVIVVGGGIVGAGIFRLSARLGLRVLLVEQRDFAWGTSSRSTKFVHGGLRYLKDLNFRMARESVLGRRQLLQDGSGLVTPIDFLLTRHNGDLPGKLGYQIILNLYSFLAGRKIHQHYDLQQLRRLVPQIGNNGLIDSFACTEAQTDDARLTLRVLGEGIASGGSALNYVQAERLIRENSQVIGIELHDLVADRTVEARARLIVNATGAWADRLRGQMKESRMMRPQRGSHLVIPQSRLQLTQNITLQHPLDRRAISITPWQTVTLVGSTDLDHDGSLEEEPRIAPEEVAYLMTAVDYAFPSLGLNLEDVMACYAGVRPIVNTDKPNPSKESRDHLILYEKGLLTVTGGKLTTFHQMAQAALKAVPPENMRITVPRSQPALDPVRFDVNDLEQPEPVHARLLGRYGNRASQVAAIAQPGDLECVPGTNVLWVELRWAARSEAVVHLEDLLLRRVSLGILLPQGGRSLLPKIRVICQVELGWDDDRWEAEQANYSAVLEHCYSIPDPSLIPPWKARPD